MPACAERHMREWLFFQLWLTYRGDIPATRNLMVTIYTETILCH